MEEGEEEVEAIWGFSLGIEKAFSRSLSSSLEREMETTRASSDTSLGADITASGLLSPSLGTCTITLTKCNTINAA